MVDWDAEATCTQRHRCGHLCGLWGHQRCVISACGNSLTCGEFGCELLVVSLLCFRPCLKFCKTLLLRLNLCCEHCESAQQLCDLLRRRGARHRGGLCGERL